MADGVTLRAFLERDLDAAGDANFVAFYDVALRHGLPSTVGSPTESRSYLRYLLAIDPLGGIVAEERGEVVGLGWAHRRGPVATIGPLAVVPRAQGRGIGRRLLERCIEAAGTGVLQVRLVQDSFNTTSLGLYLRTGFRVVAPVLECELRGTLARAAPDSGSGVSVRPATDADRARVVARDARAFGAERPQSIDTYLQRGRAVVAERGTTVAGYALGIGAHGVAHLGSASAEDPETLLVLLATVAEELAGPGIVLRLMVPAGDRRVVDGLLQLGFRAFRACQYMVRGGGTAPPPNYVLMNGDMM